ncbi:MAG: TPM domain-containing protein [Bacteroidales bacterium]
MSASDLFTVEEKKQIKEAIIRSELNTSGEISVHVDRLCKEDVLDHAAWLFKKKKMDRTALRNGVLLYIALESKKMAIIGDQGINAIVPKNFWEATKDKMMQSFKQGLVTEGIVAAVLEVGVLLKDFFPYQKGDINELSDDMTFDK